MQSRSDQHLQVMAEAPGGCNAAVVEEWNSFWVYDRRKREWITEDAVLELSDQVGFPA